MKKYQVFTNYEDDISKIGKDIENILNNYATNDYEIDQLQIVSDTDSSWQFKFVLILKHIQQEVYSISNT